ncbi:DUF4870 domain-containing protein [Candidatus Pacearchaeota archaeon]|nr:DUF4870 domain-containing protein [Candidatus Pacearchaeota archaeon]
MKKEMKNKNDDSKLFAFIAAFLSIIGFIIALLAKKDDKYVMHYAKQSLIIFIIFMIAMVTEWIPFIGKIISPIVNIAGLVFWAMSWIYALSGKMKEIPLISEYAEKMKI